MNNSNTHITLDEIINSLDDKTQCDAMFARLKAEQPILDEIKGVKLFLEQNNYDIDKLKVFLATSETEFDTLIVPSKPKNNWLKIAAVLVPIVAISSYFFLFNTSKTEKLYAKYYEKEIGLPVLMGTNEKKAFNESMNAFKDNDFEEAKAGFEVLLKEDADNDTLLYYLACSNMELDKLDVALIQFEQVEEASSFSEKAEFRIALTNIKMKKIDVAKLELMKIKSTESHQYQAKAEAILKEIE